LKTTSPPLSPFGSMEQCKRCERGPSAVNRSHAYGLDDGMTSTFHQFDDLREEATSLEQPPEAGVVAERCWRDSNISGDVDFANLLRPVQMFHQPRELAWQQILVNVGLVSKLVAPLVIQDVDRNGWERNCAGSLSRMARIARSLITPSTTTYRPEGRGATFTGLKVPGSRPDPGAGY
jgi:hypothetical protein